MSKKQVFPGNFMLGLGIAAVVFVGFFGQKSGVFEKFLSFSKNVPFRSNFVSSGKLSVATSFYPIYEVVRQVGGDNVAAKMILPAGVEPHDFEPTAQDVSHLYASPLFIYNGFGLEPWAERLRPDLESKGVTVISMQENLLAAADYRNSMLSSNPHFWLDPVHMKTEVGIVENALIKLDPANAAEYKKRGEEFTQKLEVLEGEYSKGLLKCEQHSIVTAHDAFGYLGKRYGFEIQSIAGISPEEEPNPKRLAALIEFVKKNQVEYVFFESLVSPKLAETIANETGAKTLVLNPLESISTEELGAGKNYLSIMRENLAALKLALQCH